jgi:hypothetical protein
LLGKEPPLDGRKRVANLVRHAGGQRAQRRKLLITMSVVTSVFAFFLKAVRRCLRAQIEATDEEPLPSLSSSESIIAVRTWCVMRMLRSSG